MKKQFIAIALTSIASLLSNVAFSQTCSPGVAACTSTGSTPSSPTSVSDANIVLRTMSGGTVSSILPNTQYQLRITQPSGSANSYLRMCPNEGFGFLENGTDWAQDAGQGQTRTRVITSDSFGGIIVVTVRGGSGGGVFKLCMTAGTRDSFRE
jgi:hypothetical protein